MSPKRQIIKVSDIYLDTGNFRIEESDSQEESFENMLLDQKDNLVNLADDIVAHGLSPAEQLMVVKHPSEKGKYIVFEGNRRITALKFLENPDLIQDPAYAKAFKNLSNKFGSKKINEVECVIFQDKNSALHWIDRKHQRLNGRGLTQWGAEANARREEYLHGKLRPSKIVLDYLETQGLLDDDLSKSIRRRTTNVDRVFQMPYLKDRFGIVINRKEGSIGFETLSEEKGRALVLKMIERLADKEFPVRRILDRQQRISFIEEFSSFLEVQTRPNENSPSSSNPSSIFSPGNTTSNTSSFSPQDTPSSTSHHLPPPTNAKPHYPKIKDTLSRNTLALTQQQYSFSVKDSRLSRMYREARRIDPNELNNASSLLLRVFLELSVDHYLTTKKTPIPQLHLSKGRKNWTDIGIPLNEKVQKVLDELDPTKKDHELKNARKALSGDKDMLHSIGSLHDLIHNRFGEQSDKELKQVWERWQPFWKRLYDSL